MDGVWEILDGFLVDFVEEFGYKELFIVFLIVIGYLVVVSWFYYFVVYKLECILVCIFVSGQWLYYCDCWLCLDIWGECNINKIFCLEIMGEYELVYIWSNEGLKECKEYLLLFLSMLVCFVEGYFVYILEKV